MTKIISQCKILILHDFLARNVEIHLFQKPGAFLHQSIFIEDASDAPSSTNVVKITLSETLSEMMLKRYMTNVEGTAELRDEKTILITFDNKEGK